MMKVKVSPLACDFCEKVTEELVFTIEETTKHERHVIFAHKSCLEKRIQNAEKRHNIEQGNITG